MNIRVFRRLVLFVAATLLLVVSACSDDPTGPNDGLNVFGWSLFFGPEDDRLSAVISVYNDNDSVGDAQVMINDDLLVYNSNSFSYRYSNGWIPASPGMDLALQVTTINDTIRMYARIPEEFAITQPADNAVFTMGENIELRWPSVPSADQFLISVVNDNTDQTVHYELVSGSATSYILPAGDMTVGPLVISIFALNGEGGFPADYTSPAYRQHGFWASTGDAITVAMYQ